MVLGTASGVGKSTLVIALCRMFALRGFKVAPFKAQNICDRIHYLSGNKKIARSSAIAAYAAKTMPHTDMNPVLIVPSKENECETYCNGIRCEPSDDSQVKQKLFVQASAAYKRLLTQYDIVIVEGAGSPVELNLLENDIVNMAFATRHNIPAILVSEINRGGVFASIYGTLQLLKEKQRKFVVATVVNKFMGNPEAFAKGVEILEEITELPVLGVIPYLNILLEDEDSFNEGFDKTKEMLSNGKTDTRYMQSMESEIDKLAHHIEKHLTIDMLYDRMCKRSQK